MLPHGARLLLKSESPPYGGLAGLAAIRSLHGLLEENPTTDVSIGPLPPPLSRNVPVVAFKYLRSFFGLVKSLGPSERWITVHPNGRDEKGVPVLIRQAPDGSAKVIGGAGGKLNHLKLTGVRSEGDYKDEARKRAQGRRALLKVKRDDERKAGLTESKSKAREAVQAQVADHRAKFVDTVAKAMGWDQGNLEFPEHLYQNASEAAVKKAKKKHETEIFKRAQEAVDTQRKRLVQDAEARSAAGLGEVPLTTAKPEEISVQDLDPIAPATKGLGFSTDYGKRAEAAGATKEEIKAEAAAAKPPPAKPPAEGAPAPGVARREKQKQIADELEAIRGPGPTVDQKKVIDARAAVELLKAEKAMKAAEKSARDHRAAIDEAKEPVEPKAYVVEVANAATDRDVVKDLENDLRTLRTRAFLDEVGKVSGGVESLGRHIGVGAYNSVNALALAAGGASLVDRSVVDVLGVAGAAQVLARRLHADMSTDEMETLRQAMGSFHVDHYMRVSEDALRQARDWHELAHEIEVGDAATGVDLAQGQELNATRRDLVEKAQKVLGTAVGEMEANAALVVALEQPKKDQVQASLGKTSLEDAIKQARAIGLERGDYQVERIGASTMMTVNTAGMARLAKPVDRAGLARVKGALDIIEGRQDEDNWLPAGVANRPDLAMHAEPGVAPRLAKPFRAGGDLAQSIKDFIGGRAADGDPAADIMADLLSEDTLQKSGNRAKFMAELGKIAPLYDGDKMIRVETHQGAFDAMADDFVERNYGGEMAPLHRQKFDVDQTSVDALHRALAEHPDGVAAFKPVGDLTPQDQTALRNAFVGEHGRANPAVESLRADLEKLDEDEPEREVDDMLGRGANPAWIEWNGRRNGVVEKINKATMTWAKYLGVMGSPAKAYAAIQDTVRSKVLRSFANAHNTLRPDVPLKVGRVAIVNGLGHIDALDPAARARRQTEELALRDRYRNRKAGKYASGAVSDKIEAARAAEEAAAQSQMNMFGANDDLFGGGGAAPDGEPVKERPLQLGERYTIGHQAERQVAGMMPQVGANFRPGQPTKLWQPTMSGKYIGRQRAVKLIAHNRRTMLGLGVGSGKTSISLAAFTHLHAQGKAKRGLFVVPSVVQGQFHGEALTLLKPDTYKWHCNPGADRAERIAAYKDPDTHFNVVTHQAFRDDMLHLAGMREGLEPAAVADKLDNMAPAERKTYMRDLLAAEGIDHDYMAIDEGHNLLNRAGKANSNMANVIDAISHNMGTYVSMTADPVKNDASEAFDVLAKMDPDRYSDRDAFMRRYGVNTAASKAELQREMARHFYTGRIDPGVKANKTEVPVAMSPEQQGQIKLLDQAAARARLARMQGKVDTDALRTLAPSSFDGVDPARHVAVAASLNKHLGILHHTAVHHAVNGGAKTDALAKIAGDRRGKQGVVFVHHLDRVAEIADRLRREGHSVVTLTGGDSSKEKDDKKRAFQDGKHSVIVCSDAGAVGANLQAGKWLVQYDTPMTAMVHAQRQGRINRIGQSSDVELLDLVGDHKSERAARKRLAEKYELRDIMTSPLDGLDDRGIAGYINRVRSGQREAERPHFLPAQPDEAPAGLEEEGQRSMF